MEDIPRCDRKTASTLLCALLAWGAPAASGAGETLFLDGAVWTADPARPRAEAILVRDGRIHHVGTGEEAARLAGDGARVIDLEGRMLLPGFVESHTHPAVAGLLNSKLQVVGTLTVADVQAALEAYADAHPDDGFGFPSALNTAVNAAGVKGSYRKDLDAVVPDRPVVLIALDAHGAWVNSKALEVAGITKDTPDPVPGVHYYQRDGNGEPTGWMVEGNAFWPLLPRFGIGSEADFRAAFTATLPKYSAMGITAVFDAGIPGGDALLRNALHARKSGTRREPSLALPRQRVPQPPGGRGRRHGTADHRDTPGLRLRAHRRPHREDPERRHHRRRDRGGARPLRRRRQRRGAALRGAAGPVLRRGAGGRPGCARPCHRRPHPAGDPGRGGRRPRRGAPIGQPFQVAHVMLAAPEDLRRLKPLDVMVQTTPHRAHDLGGTLALYSRLLDRVRGARIMLLRDLRHAAPLVAFGADYPAMGLPFAKTSPLYGIGIAHTRRAPGAAGG